MLQDNILAYWSKHTIDEKHGGFFGQIDGHNEVQPEADKGVILLTRILWTFSASYGGTKNEQYLQVADRAYSYLLDHFVDPVHQGVYWMVDYQGAATQSKKQVYAQAFAIYALSEYYKVQPAAPEALGLARELFGLIERHALDVEHNGYLEALSRSWGPLEDVRLSTKDLNAVKTMNTHLHLMEAYTNLLGVWPSPLLKNRLRDLVELMLDRFIGDDHHFHLFFDAEWNLLSREFSFGHDIEGSWLLTEATGLLYDERLRSKTQRLSLQMVRAALMGLDRDGGLMNAGQSEGFTDTNKDWWPQAEALVGLVNAWQITGEASYLQSAEKIVDFIETYLLDPTGEWYWGVTRGGVPLKEEDKAGPWKCPYHNGRAMLELMARLP